MRNFKIKGRVLANQSPNQGIPGLRVEAWDKDLLFHDRLGSAITDNKGEFVISFSGSDFNDLFFDKYPDVFFKVYAGETLLKDTRRATQWNVGVEVRDIYEMPDIFVDYVVEEPPTELPKTGEKGSTRSIFKATYTPRKTKSDEADAPNTRGLEKGRFIASLNPSPAEIKLLLEKCVGSKKGETPDKLNSALSIISSSIRVNEKINILKHAKQFAQIDLPTLWQFADELIAKRAENVKPGEQGQKQGAELAQMRKNVALAKENFKVVPVGYLHLEKMSFTPAGIERGELVYSLPLAPGEEVNMAHKEWSRTSEEFERLVTDYMEDFSEEGVAEKSEFADAVNTQSQHSEAYNLSVSASGSYGGFSISSSFGYNASDSSSKSQQTSRKQSHDITQKASSRVTKEHKVSFKVASASEVEDQSVRKIVNPFKDRATRVDYYQLIRKWEVNLYRYGMRLTWDLAIPEPGSGLLSKINQLIEAQKELEKPYEFDLLLASNEQLQNNEEVLSDENYEKYIEKYNVILSQLPPKKYHYIIESFFFNKRDFEDYNAKQLTIKLPEGYKIRQSENSNNLKTWGFVPVINVDLIDDENSLFWLSAKNNTVYFKTYGGFYNPENPDSEIENHPFNFENPCPFFENHEGNIVFSLTQVNTNFILIDIHFFLERTTESYEAWRINTYNQIAESAKNQYFEKRQILKAKIETLEKELENQDALSLRKKEREEIMKGVLRWMGIQGMEFFPSEITQPDGEMDIENVIYDKKTGLVREKDENNKDLNIYNPMMSQGEIIKFLHQAIEWENMLYFLYPYFWTHPSRWDFKKYLEHPDPQHKAFLKAGSARVVLTIRPGFEHAFLTFKDTGEMDGLPKYPYLTIGEEYRHFAQTNYPGIPPANPVKNYRPQFTYKQIKTWERMDLVIKLLNVYFRVNRTYPNCGSNWFSVLLAIFPMKDPWGRDYIYNIKGENFAVSTYGKNGKQDQNPTNVEDTDIYSTWLDNGEYPSVIYQVGSKHNIAWQDIMLFMELLEKYKEIKGEYPSEKEGLAKLKDLFINKDEWNHEFIYAYPGEYGEFDLASYGKDGKPGGEGEDADITSWAEATLIGQWYEYTPTSAMDIAFDEKMPND